MATTFGRRACPQTSAQPAKTVREPAMPEAILPRPSAFAAGPAADVPSLDDELREWKQNRKSGFQIPWPQLSLMASLCFGIASFVLPDGTNEAVNWLLYALMAASFVAGISRRRRKRAEAARPA
jgi:hypothetical protein